MTRPMTRPVVVSPDHSKVRQKEEFIVKPLLSGLLVIGVTATVFIAAQTVSAHSRPVRFDPAPGQVIEEAPAQVTGWFTSPLRRDPNWTFIKVSDEEGNEVTTGDITLTADRKQLSVALEPDLPPGRYLVNHRTWDDEDNEIVGDCFVFFIGQAAAHAAVAEDLRLDGGAECERIEFSAAEGTPAPGRTPGAQEGEEEHEEEGAAEAVNGGESHDSDAVAAWLLIVTGGAGLVVGAVGTRLFSNRRG